MQRIDFKKQLNIQEYHKIEGVFNSALWGYLTPQSMQRKNIKELKIMSPKYNCHY
jgi:hypothetical protein